MKTIYFILSIILIFINDGTTHKSHKFDEINAEMRILITDSKRMANG